MRAAARRRLKVSGWPTGPAAAGALTDCPATPAPERSAEREAAVAWDVRASAAAAAAGSSITWAFSPPSRRDSLGDPDAVGEEPAAGTLAAYAMEAEARAATVKIWAPRVATERAEEVEASTREGGLPWGMYLR